MGLGEGLVRYNWLVGKLIIPPCVCRKLIPNTTGKRIFLVTTSCPWNVSLLIAVDMNVLPSAIKVYHLLLILKMREVAVAVLSKASGITARARGLWSSRYLSKMWQACYPNCLIQGTVGPLKHDFE